MSPFAIVNDPVDEGWYWYRHNGQHLWSVREVLVRKGHRVTTGLHDDENLVENYPGDWVRIYEPDDADVISDPIPGVEYIPVSERVQAGVSEILKQNNTN